MNPISNSAILDHNKRLSQKEAIVLKMLNKTYDDMHIFYEKMRVCIDEINQMDMSTEDKKEMIYNFICGTQKTLLGYNLSTEGALIVARELMFCFDNTQIFIEHELLPKFDRDGLKLTKVKNEEEMKEDDREGRTGTIHQ